MADKKIYSIQINGIQESVNAVEALNAQLKTLEARIKALENSSVKVNAGGSSSSNSSSASEEAAVQREINKLKAEGANLDAKIAAAQDEVYKRVDATKQLYKETIADQKAMAAQERLTADAYSNTMQGMKSQLADLKAVINTTDLGDGDSIKKMTQQANELTNKLKEMEQSYGQFGRNVGNYANGVADGLSKIKINVGDTVREFGSAREASRTLNEELKAMAINGETDTKAFKDLRQTVMELESTMKDVKSPMDDIMDGFQSLTAIAATTQGISALFGLDDSKIEESIQKLVALQNIMQGIDTINKQIQTREGIGGWIAKSNQSVKKFTDSLFGLNKTAKTTTTTINTTNVALNGTNAAGKNAAVGLGTATVAANTSTVAFKAATVAATALRVVLMTLGIGIVIGAIGLAVEAITEWIGKVNEAKKAQEELNNALAETKGQYAKSGAEITLLQERLNRFNGSKKQEKKLVEELNSEYGKAFGEYKTLAEWKKVLAEKGKIYCQILLKEAEAQALLNTYAANFVEISKAIADGDNERVARLQMYNETIMTRVSQLYKEINSLSQKYQLFDYSNQIDKGSKNTAKSLKKANDNITKLRLELMSNSFQKVIAQLRAERDARIKEAKETGYKVAEQEDLIRKLYQKKEIEATVAHYERLTALRQQYQDELRGVQENTMNMNINTSRSANKNKLENSILSKTSNGTLEEMKKQGKFDKFMFDYALVDPQSIELNIKNINSVRKAYDNLTKVADRANERLKKLGVTFEQDGKNLKALVPDNLSEESSKEINGLLSTYEGAINSMMVLQKGYKSFFDGSLATETKGLYEAIRDRTEVRRKYYDTLLQLTKDYYKKEREIRDTEIDNEEKKLSENEEKRHNNLVGKRRSQTLQSAQDLLSKSVSNGDFAGWDTSKIETYMSKYKEVFDKWLADQDEALRKGEISIEEYTDKTSGKLLKSYKNQEISFVQFLTLMNQEDETHQNTMTAIEKSAQEKRKTNQKEYQDGIMSATKEHNSNIISEISEAVSTITNMRDKAEQRNAWGIIDYKKTKENLKTLQKAINAAFVGIQARKTELSEQLSKGEIKFADYDASIKELNAFENILKQHFQSIQEDSKNLIGSFVQSMQVYLNAVVDSFQTIMSAVWDAQDVAFDKEQEQLDKWNDELDKKLDKQQEIIEQHKSAIDSIEDELATSRGDRRQHLIDQLNAEIEAQRAAQAEEQRIQKEKERAEKKQEELELKRKKAEYKRNLTQAIVNGAMAVTMAAINKWPVPAIPMMALAASTTAAQIAIMASNKPYRVGGQLEGGLVKGKRHSEGGVPVGNTGIEVEGDEMIIRRESTMPNIDLLNYINKSQRKLSLDDFVDFYSSGKIKKSITSMSPKAKYADGGLLTLNNEYNFDNRLLDAFERYAEKPTVVQVVDIVDKMDSLRKVETLAGLSPTY